MLAHVTFILPGSLASPPAMHIPDGMLSPAVAVAFWLVTIAAISVATRRVHSALGERQIPLMGIMAAFIFAAQMINFPIVGGTSGHLLGGVLAAVLLGPWAAILVMAVVIAAQGLLFQDGGLLVMGANIFNMGILTAVIGYGLYRLVVDRAARTRLAVVAAAAWLAVIAAALATSLELWLSGTSDLRTVVRAMLGVHAAIGVGEALITVAAVAFVWRARPDLARPDATPRRTGLAWSAAGMGVSLLVVLLAPFASLDPDGLERVAGQLGFLAVAQPAPYELLPDYTIPLLGPTRASTIVAGALGALIVAALAVALGHLVRRRAAPADASEA